MSIPLLTDTGVEVLAMESNATVTWGRVSESLFRFLALPEETAGARSDLGLIFGEGAKLLSAEAALFHVPTSDAQGF